MREAEHDTRSRLNGGQGLGEVGACELQAGTLAQPLSTLIVKD